MKEGASVLGAEWGKCSEDVQGWAIEWFLGCVNSRPAARGSQEAGFTQPRDHSFAQRCTSHRKCAFCPFLLGPYWHLMIYSHFVEVLQHAEDVAGERLDAVLAEVPAKNERENRE